MALLNRMQLLKKEDLKIEKVVFEDGSDDFVFVRQMTGRERDSFEETLTKEIKNDKGEIDYKRDIRDFRAKLAVHTLCDAKGKNLMSVKDIPLLSVNMSAYRLECIVNAAQKINKISEEDRNALVKNLEGDRKEGSTSDSPKS